MAVYPVNLDITGRKCAVIGGGGVAERKVGDLLAAGAAVTVISPALTPALDRLAEMRTITYIARSYEPGDIEDFFIVICATDNKVINAAAASEATANGSLVNVADNPGLCDFSVPAKVVRGDLVITVSTGGHSPAVARQIRLELEERYGPEYEVLLELVGAIRAEMKQTLPGSKDREFFWRQALDKSVLSLVEQGNLKEAEEKIRHAIGCTRSQS